MSSGRCSLSSRTPGPLRSSEAYHRHLPKPRNPQRPQLSASRPADRLWQQALSPAVKCTLTLQSHEPVHPPRAAPLVESSALRPVMRSRHCSAPPSLYTPLPLRAKPIRHVHEARVSSIRRFTKRHAALRSRRLKLFQLQHRSVGFAKSSSSKTVRERLVWK